MAIEHENYASYHVPGLAERHFHKSVLARLASYVGLWKQLVQAPGHLPQQNAPLLRFVLVVTAADAIAGALSVLRYFGFTVAASRVVLLCRCLAVSAAGAGFEGAGGGPAGGAQAQAHAPPYASPTSISHNFSPSRTHPNPTQPTTTHPPVAHPIHPTHLISSHPQPPTPTSTQSRVCAHGFDIHITI